jgi:hypothetical protein
MGRAARQYMQGRSFEAAFDETWEIFSRLNGKNPAAA